MTSTISKYSNSIMTLLMLVIFTGMVVIASRYPAGARFMPFVLGFPAIALCLLQLFLDARERHRTARAKTGPSDIEKAEEQVSRVVGHQVHFDVGNMLLPESSSEGPQDQVRREMIAWAYFLAFIVGIVLFGFHVSVPVFLILFLRYRAEASWRLTLGLTAFASFMLFFAFENVLRVSLHQGFITERLRELIGG